MAESKKLVIKINYDKNLSNAPIKPAKMVTVWHTKRIAALAVAVLALMLIAVILLQRWEENKIDEARSGQSVDSSMQSAAEDALAVKQAKINPQADERLKSGQDKAEPASLEVKRVSAIIFDKAVIRASLNSALKDNEPYEQVARPIKLAINQKIVLYYFNELKGIKHKVFYHYWSKDGKLVYKKQLEVKRKQLKINSEKVLSYNDKGNWQVQLVDKKGKVFSEVNFVVDAE